MCDEYEEDYDEEESEGLILSIGDDGKAEIHKPEDYIHVKEEEMKVIQAYLKKNWDDFQAFIKKDYPSLIPKKMPKEK